MIEVTGLTRRFGTITAVDRLSFSVAPGRVTGFLGPNGAGKSTTMRMILGLDRPTEGIATISGVPYAELEHPFRTVGALLEERSVHPGRTAYDHLLFLAQAQRLPRRRVEEVLGLVGLGDVAGRRAKGLSLGMGQRLGIAAAMLGDPEVLLLDEPVNGLDPEGVLWIRNLMKELAGEGRTVFVSSHLMNEMAVTARHLVVIGRGRLLADCPTSELLARGSEGSVRVVSPDAARLAGILRSEGATVGTAAPEPPDTTDLGARDTTGALSVTGLGCAQIGRLAAAASIELHALHPRRLSLEDAFMELTADSGDLTTLPRHDDDRMTDRSCRA
ncbi:MAG: ATP-binding cassette domain-containing protein [Actinomycetota bacterium]|nr:ATP-binding cassette domain-containing protein [Actinomycetota bacterium]